MSYKNVTVNHAFEHCQQDNCCLVDVRTVEECAEGTPQNSINIVLDELANNIDKLDKNHDIYLICRSGVRSVTASNLLLKLGFNSVYNVLGGYIEWTKQNLPTIRPSNTSTDNLRYSRHYQLQGFGKQAQDKLNKAHVLIIGAGGLGSPTAMYLAAAGVGEITIIDDDKVELSNLQRQIIHTTNAINSPKVNSAKKRMNAINPEITINAIAKRFDENSGEELIKESDVIIDGSDNLSTRYLANDLSVKHKKPLIYAAVYQFEAQISVFDLRQQNAPCLRCLFPQTQGFEPENCSTQGVLGVVPGFAGILQASEAIKTLTSIGQTLIGKLLIVDLRENSFRTISYKKSPQCNHHL